MDARQGEIGPSNRAPYRRGGPAALKGEKQRQHGIQLVEGSTEYDWAKVPLYNGSDPT